MAVTQNQKTQFITSVRSATEQLVRTLSMLDDLRNVYNDLGLTNIVNSDLIGDNSGLDATDVTAALATVNNILNEFTVARRASLNKIGHGSL
jgi:hypothetical protein